MKRVTRKQRDRDVARSLCDRSRSGASKQSSGKAGTSGQTGLRTASHLKSWLTNLADTKAVDLEIDRKGRVTVRLPYRLDFYKNYEVTALYIRVVRKLANLPDMGRKRLRLQSVLFDNLHEISTSAALVLTSEMCRWNERNGRVLTAHTERWQPEIRERLLELGFLDLMNGVTRDHETAALRPDGIRMVRYIRDHANNRESRFRVIEALNEIIGDELEGSLALSSGLSEAIYNVARHAYPDRKYNDSDRYWYLTAAYDRSEDSVKIVFFDQGITIPKTLPTSGLWEGILGILSRVSEDDRTLDKTLLKAAMQASRTRTKQDGHGNGLPQLLDFIDMRGRGYVAVLSGKGLYKYEVGSQQTEKTEAFENKLPGTLIIWKVYLER